MKLQSSAAVLIIVIVAFTDTRPGRGRDGGGRGGRRGGLFEALLSRPVCQCYALESCIDEKSAAKETCKVQCSYILERAGGNVGALEQCFEMKEEDDQEMRACMDQELGKNCDDGTGVTDAPRGQGGRRGKGRREGGRDRRQHRGQMPQALKDYEECVHDCARPEGSENSRGRRQRAKGGRHIRGGDFAAMVCMMEQKCRSVRHSRDAKEAAHEICKPRGSVDHEAMCACVRDAGFPDLDCSPSEGGSRKKRDGGLDDSEEDDSGEDD